MPTGLGNGEPMDDLWRRIRVGVGSMSETHRPRRVLRLRSGRGAAGTWVLHLDTARQKSSCAVFGNLVGGVVVASAQSV